MESKFVVIYNMYKREIHKGDEINEQKWENCMRRSGSNCHMRDIGLVVFGVDTINQTDAVLPEPGDLMPAFYALLAVMAGSILVMIAALAKKK